MAGHGTDGAILRIAGGRIAVELLAAGASIRAIRLYGAARSLVVGARDMSVYGAANKAFLGALIGRNANRVAHGRLPIGGTVHQLTRNEPPHHLHGGATGLWSHDWRVEELSAERCVMAIEAEDGEDGYPGRASVTATFAIVDETTLSITYEGTVDAPSALNMTSHLYFNLSGTVSTQDHRLQVAAAHYLPVDAELVPTGIEAKVEGTLFDFRAGRRLDEGPALLDHNFCLAAQRSTTPRPAAVLSSEQGAVALHLATTECGLQVYDGGQFDGTIADLDGRAIARHGAIALEPQAFPDWPNRPAFPGGLLLPGETYRHTSLYRFEAL